jgi:hypothetical protein
MIGGYEPVLKGIGRWNLELVGLATRRTRAWLEIPQHLGQCKSPTDLLNAQMRFWQSAAADYAEVSHKLAAAIGASAVVPHLNGALPRDYITFAEPKESAVEPRRSDRKAA